MSRIHPRRFGRRGTFATAGLVLAAVVAVAVSAAAVPAQSAAPRQTEKHLRALKDTLGTKDLWAKTAKPRRAAGRKVGVHARKARPMSLNTARLRSVLARAPRERTTAARTNPLVISLPAPNGSFHRFALVEYPIMAPGLARKHPEIKAYRGRGITDRTATIHADISPLGFHASVRSSYGAWYIDPYFVGRSPGVHASYYGRDAQYTQGPFVERESHLAELSVDRGYYHASDTVSLHGGGLAGNATITVTISDPTEDAATRTVSATSDGQGSFDASFVADPDGKLDVRVVEASDGVTSAHTSYQVVRDDDPTTDPPTGPELRTYRLALITDPGYSAYFGGPANVTAAKVALMNRVNQIYEDDLTIRMQFVANNDLLNLNTYADTVAPNGPCGSAGCYTQAQVLGCTTARHRIVIGQIIGASNYDVGHIALGQPGGGVAGLGVVGRANKANGCTGLATPVGDFFAVDYVAHELGHQFSGNHTFNGNQLNCSGGNRSAAQSVEPGSGSSVQAYAGICLTDDLQPHSDPYFSQRSQQEMTTYVASEQLPINETQTVSLRRFGGGNEVQVATLGPGFADVKTVAPVSSAIGAVPSATSRGGAMQVGNTVTIFTPNPHSLQPGDVVTISGVAETGYNGTFTITSVPVSRSFTYEHSVTGLPVSGGGTVTPAVPGASAVGTTATIRTTIPHNRSVGDFVTITTGGGFAGTFPITAVPTPRTFQYQLLAAPTTNPNGGGSSTYSSPFRIRIGGSTSGVIGGNSLPYNDANLTAAVAALSPGATVTGAATTGFNINYTGGVDVPNAELVDLSCGGCFASVQETNHGGAFDSFRLNYNGTLSAPIVNGTNYTLEAVQLALQGASEVQTVSLTGYDTDGDSYTLNYEGTDTVPITRGQNNTAAGIAAALQGGNEQQQVTLTGFNAATAGHSFQVQIGGNNSAVLGNGGLALNNANVAAAVNAIPGFAGTVTSAGAGNGGFTLTFGGPSANTDVPAISIVNLACAPACSSALRETVKGTPPVAGWPAGGTVTVGTVSDTGYTLTFGSTHQGTDVPQVTVTNGSGVTGTTAETVKGTSGIVPPRTSAIVAGFGGGTFNNTGFQVSYGGGLANTNNPVTLTLSELTDNATSFTGETDKGGAVDNGGTITATGNNWPSVSVPDGFTIPLRTPFALTGSATDAEGDAIVYSWEQNDRGGNAGTSLLFNTKLDGPLFAMFPKSAPISETDTLQYNSPNQNHVTPSPTRVFPDLEQILANNTNAETGTCQPGPIAPPVPIPVKECYSEFLPTSDYVGFAGVNFGPPPELHFRFTARDLRMGGGGNSAADLTLKLAANAGPFLVTAPNTAVTYPGGSTQTIAWDKANTDLPPVGTTDVKISLSADGGRTYPHVLAASTPNDGAASVTIPHVATSSARVKIEALGNVFFDVSNANFTITDTLKPTITASVAPPPNAAGWHNSNVTVTLTAADDASGSGVKSITYSATGAQPIQSTTVNAATTSVVISANGITTLSYFATDNEGNTSDLGTTTVKLDKVAPEAYLQFDPVKRDIAVFGRDGLSGTPAGPLTPSRVQRVPSGDKNLRVEIRTYDLADAAGNTLQLVHSTGLMKNDAVAGIQTLQYNGGAVVRPVYNVMFFDWKLKKDALDDLHQEFLVISPLQRATADWQAKDNQTLVWSLAGGQTTVPGLFLLRLATSNGALSIETTP
jgi:hypothetical protein